MTIAALFAMTGALAAIAMAAETAKPAKIFLFIFSPPEGNDRIRQGFPYAGLKSYASVQPLSKASRLPSLLQIRAGQPTHRRAKSPPMNKLPIALMTVLVLAVVAVAGKMWVDSANRPAPAAAPASGPVVEAQVTADSTRPASMDSGAPTPAAFASAEPNAQDENPDAKPKAEAPANEKLEMQKSLWAGAWGRQLPDPNYIDMDTSQLGKPGGKAVPIPYVEPPPLPSGSYVTNADGTQSMVLGNTIVNADGSKATIDGHQILKSDGTLGVMVGNDILWSDGSKSTR